MYYQTYHQRINTTLFDFAIYQSKITTFDSTQTLNRTFVSLQHWTYFLILNCLIALMILKLLQKWIITDFKYILIRFKNVFIYFQSKLAHIGESRMEKDYKLVENEGLFQEYLEMGKTCRLELLKKGKLQIKSQCLKNHQNSLNLSSK